MTRARLIMAAVLVLAGSLILLAGLSIYCALVVGRKSERMVLEFTEEEEEDRPCFRAWFPAAAFRRKGAL